MPTVTFQPERFAIPIPDGQSVLAGLRCAGYSLRFGCRRGGCGICRIDLLAGDVTYPTPVAALTDADRAGNTVLACQAVPRTDVVVRLRGDRLRRLLPWLTSPASHPTTPHHQEGPVS